MTVLQKSYNKAIIGFNYLSLAFSIISLKRDESVLLIDEPDIVFANKWFLNLGLLEVNLIKSIGETYEIAPLSNLDKYLTTKNTIINFDDTMIELSDSPYANVREFARKLPMTFNDVYQDFLLNIDPESFDKDLFLYLEKIVKGCLENFKNEKLSEAFNVFSGHELEQLVKKFTEYLASDELENKQVHFILQVLNQSIFSSSKSDFESQFLLLSSLSPRYEVNESALMNDLIFEFRKMGGDLKKCQIKDWGIAKNELDYLLLNSLDGVIKVSNTYIFGNFSDQYPFYSDQEKNKYLSIELSGFIDHKFLEQFKSKRIVFSQKERMGGDFPYWEVSINNSGKITGTYCYADYQGSKDTFYYTHCIEDLYNSLAELLPGLKRADFISSVKLTPGRDTWYNVENQKPNNLKPSNLKPLSRLYLNSNKKKIEGIELCSTLRSRSLGLYSYLLDLFT
jgi:hypothetical protein